MTPSPKVARTALALFAAVAFALAIARVIWHVPLQLLLFLAATFTVSSASFWIAHHSRAPSVIRQLAAWLLPWGLAATAVLGAVYRIDRAGWAWTRLTGYNATWEEHLQHLTEQSLADVVARYPILELEPGLTGGLVLPPGRHEVRATIVIPAGTRLTIEPGARLHFAPGRSLIAYSPVIAHGTAGAPITFTALHTPLKWGAVGLVDADGSSFAHVRFSHGRQANVNGVPFPGTVSLIRSDAEISRSTFADTFGKDALYVREGTVRIRDNVIRDTFKDGIDFDGGRGEIAGNRLIDCGDEAIDLSGTRSVSVFDNVILDRHGGRISTEGDTDAIRAENTLGHSDDDEGGAVAGDQDAGGGGGGP